MIKDKFLETIREYKLLKPGELVLAAVSGGADSVALLNLLSACKKEMGISLHVAHVNHLLRKGDAEMDARYVQDLGQRLSIPVTVETVDVAAVAQKEKMGIEQAARKSRYEIFDRMAKRVGAAKIALGHSADDNVETFLMRLLRGTGLKGLCGIPVKRGKIVRPLIKIWRREIEDYVGGLKLVPRQDLTNYESKYLRNRVRLKLIPQLKLYNLNIKEIILQTILLLTDDYEYLETKAEDELAGTVISKYEKEIKMDAGKLRKIDPAIQGHLVRLAIERVKGDLTDLSYKHVHDILENIEAGEKWELHLPGGVYASGSRDKFIITREKPETALKKNYQYTLSVPGEIDIKEVGKKLSVQIVEKPLLEVRSEEENVVLVDASALGRNIIVRNKQDGDRFYPLGMKGSKKVQDLFVDEKIPFEERDSVPVVESGGQIIWVAGVRLDERAKVTGRTKKAVRLELL